MVLSLDCLWIASDTPNPLFYRLFVIGSGLSSGLPFTKPLWINPFLALTSPRVAQKGTHTLPFVPSQVKLHLHKCKMHLKTPSQVPFIPFQIPLQANL